jgi:flagellar motor switch protein FliN
MSAASSADVVSAYVQALLTACGTTLSTILNRAITLEVEPPLREPSEPLLEALPLPWVVTYARFTRGLTGVHHLVIGHKDVPLLTRLMLGEDSTEPVLLTSEQEDLLHDVANQVMASVSASLRTIVGRAVTVVFADQQRIEGAEAFQPHAGAVVVGQIVAEGTPRARFALTVPLSVITAMESAASQGDTGRLLEDVNLAGLDMILDIAMPVTVELGRTKMLIRDILALGPGSVIELDKLAGEPVDLLVNERPIAKGEVVVIDENFGVRLTQISHPVERLRSLG